MKKAVLILFIFTFLFSCKKRDENEYKDVYGEIIYTDSFSPIQWENPLSRNNIQEVDMDIGKFIKQDVMDPKLRRILKLVENYVYYIKQKDSDKIKSILTPSAFNSFSLRIPDINFDKKYKVRVAYPESLYPAKTEEPKEESENESEVKSSEESYQTDKNHIWVDFKISFKTSSIISKLEIETSNPNNYIISDFENQFFEDLEKTFK